MYQPKMLHRVAFRYSELHRGQSVEEIVSYEDMGTPEFFGAYPQSEYRVRCELLEGVPYSLVILSCRPETRLSQVGEKPEYQTLFVQGKRLYALLSTERLERFGGPDGISAGLQDVFDGKTSLISPMEEHRSLCMWHDVQNDIYFSPNATFLKLMFSILSRQPHYSMEIDNELHIGDQVELAIIINGRSCKSVFGMNTRAGSVCSLLPNQVSIRTHGKKYRMPYVYMLTHKINVSNESPLRVAQ
jgi:hypothetical protein